MENLLELPIGKQVEYKPSLITYTVYRVSENKYQIDHTSGGWMTAIVTKNTIAKLLRGEKAFSQLNWS